jgi:hypothetical protein
MKPKKTLYDIAKKVIVDLPIMTKRQGDNRKKKEVEDLINIYETLDKSKCSLPRFVAEDLNKIPNIKIGEADVCVFTAKLCELTEVVDSLRKQMSEVLANQVSIKKFDSSNQAYMSSMQLLGEGNSSVIGKKMVESSDQFAAFDRREDRDNANANANACRLRTKEVASIGQKKMKTVGIRRIPRK